MKNKILSGYLIKPCLIAALVLLQTGCSGKAAQNSSVKEDIVNYEEIVSSKVTATPAINDGEKTIPLKGYRVLNDTGMVWGADYPEGNNETCTGDTVEQQDCSHGRDVTHNDDSDGHAGFSYTKISSTGDELPASATEWTCVKDNVTGLVWEVKTTDGGLRHIRHYYSWYNSTGINDGGWSGVPNGGTCYDDKNCDTEKYAAQVNMTTLCGASDWRLPSRMELLSLVNNNKTQMMLDHDYFPEPVNYFYVWSSTPQARNTDRAWFLDFVYGYTLTYNKQHDFTVRLVRNAQ